jgi:hypothetical protein
LLFHRKKEGRRSERRFFAIKPAHTHTHTQADADTHALFAECQRAIRYWNVKDRRKQQEIRMKAEVGGREEGRERVAKQWTRERERENTANNISPWETRLQTTTGPFRNIWLPGGTLLKGATEG